jgi:hypothetical protein
VGGDRCEEAAKDRRCTHNDFGYDVRSGPGASPRAPWGEWSGRTKRSLRTIDSTTRPRPLTASPGRLPTPASMSPPLTAGARCGSWPRCWRPWWPSRPSCCAGPSDRDGCSRSPAGLPEHQISIWCSQPPSLLCSVNDAVNFLPCSTCAYLNGRPLLTCAAFTRRRWVSGRPQTTDLAVGFESLAARHHHCRSAALWQGRGDRWAAGLRPNCDHVEGHCTSGCDTCDHKRSLHGSGLRVRSRCGGGVGHVGVDPVRWTGQLQCGW